MVAAVRNQGLGQGHFEIELNTSLAHQDMLVKGMEQKMFEGQQTVCRCLYFVFYQEIMQFCQIIFCKLKILIQIQRLSLVERWLWGRNGHPGWDTSMSCTYIHIKGQFNVNLLDCFWVVQDN